MEGIKQEHRIKLVAFWYEISTGIDTVDQIPSQSFEIYIYNLYYLFDFIYFLTSLFQLFHYKSKKDMMHRGPWYLPLIT